MGDADTRDLNDDTPPTQLVLTAHITFSVGWLGAVAVFLMLAIAGLTSQDGQTIRTAVSAMDLAARYVVVPRALASLLSGLIESPATPWGLFRQYWVLVKFLLTMFATLVLLLKMPLIGNAAQRASAMTPSSADFRMVAIQLVVHAAGGLLILLVITAISVYKPWGLTRYGQRRQQERQHEPRRSPIMSGSGNKEVRVVLSRGIRIYLAAGVGVFRVRSRAACENA